MSAVKNVRPDAFADLPALGRAGAQQFFETMVMPAAAPAQERGTVL